MATNSPHEFEVKWPPAEQPVIQSIVTSKQETIKKYENMERFSHVEHNNYNNNGNTDDDNNNYNNSNLMIIVIIMIITTTTTNWSRKGF